MLMKSALREYLPYASVTLGLAVKLATSGGFPPFGAYGTTFAPQGSMSLDFRVALRLPYKSSSFATPQKRGHNNPQGTIPLISISRHSAAKSSPSGEKVVR